MLHISLGADLDLISSLVAIFDSWSGVKKNVVYIFNFRFNSADIFD